MIVMYRKKVLSNIGSSKLLAYKVDKLKCLKDYRQLIFWWIILLFWTYCWCPEIRELSEKVHASLLEYEMDEETSKSLLTIYWPINMWVWNRKWYFCSKMPLPLNITAETILGMHDHLRRSPNASNSDVATMTGFPQINLMIGSKPSQIQATFE